MEDKWAASKKDFGDKPERKETQMGHKSETTGKQMGHDLGKKSGQLEKMRDNDPRFPARTLVKKLGDDWKTNKWKTNGRDKEQTSKVSGTLPEPCWNPAGAARD